MVFHAEVRDSHHPTLTVLDSENRREISASVSDNKAAVPLDDPEQRALLQDALSQEAFGHPVTNSDKKVSKRDRSGSKGTLSSPPRLLSLAGKPTQPVTRVVQSSIASTEISQSILDDSIAPARISFPSKSSLESLRLIQSPDSGAPHTTNKHYQAPKNPMVFCHGLMGFDSVAIGPPAAGIRISHWRGIQEALEAIGAEVFIARVPATSGPSERSKVLAKLIDEKYPGRSVHLIAHSMGGLDSRLVASKLQDEYSFKVLSVTTISCPHRGSSGMDYVLEQLGGKMNTVISLMGYLPLCDGDGGAFKALATEQMKQFNRETPDREDVQYFSWGAEYNPGLLDPLWLSYSKLKEKEGPNDGVVSVESARWGTYRGTLIDVCHWDLVGWTSAVRYTWADWTGNKIKFEPKTFYLETGDYLARFVEGTESPPAEGAGTMTTEATTGNLDFQHGVTG